ncbi:hypothetical protein LJB81_00910 [Desulfovibrio sp. OttesenSCG-928-M14]|nr:hypothetical protein [Desulfovibrio sp. OttesenSCG-928-M14]
MAGKTNNKETSSDVEKGKNKNFVPTETAQKLLERVKAETGSTIQSFINKCIEEQGPILLANKIDVEDSAPFAARFKYLEDVVEAWVFYDLEKRLANDKAALAAHKKVLKDMGKKVWFKEENIKKIITAAKNKKETSDTEPWEWQTIMRRRKAFMNM